MKYKVIPTNIASACFYFDTEGKQIEGIYDIGVSEDYNFDKKRSIKFKGLRKESLPPLLKVTGGLPLLVVDKLLGKNDER